ncbi:hypothetical protein THARTR1_00600 [Trichoderma harzianum]|uniref:O-methyltransferase n=1 Tax=Trichoderma harzianum TaxID=5544 RepID=A0A2K0UPM0_TRIHA|nr:hypothetical protein THARTR1_00600 [Trichoderma harzianum]
MSAPSPNPVVAPDHVHALLNRLHQESLTQEAALPSTYLSNPDGFDDLMRDKFIALDQDKCQFVYQLARAIGARNIAEIGTSFGVSTIYLALAVGSNVQRLGGEGKVIATEKEHTKAEKARQHWKEAGDDLLDLVLIDIWAPVALPALKMLEPKLRSGAVVIIDNSISSATRYKELLGYLRSPTNGYTNLTLPYSNGLELCVKI